MRGIRRFNVKGKLAPRYIGPFKVLERKDKVAYRLEFPTNLFGVHDVLHISQLKKCLRVPEEKAPLDGLEVQEDLTYTEHPVKILDGLEVQEDLTTATSRGDIGEGYTEQAHQDVHSSTESSQRS